MISGDGNRNCWSMLPAALSRYDKYEGPCTNPYIQHRIPSSILSWISSYSLRYYGMHDESAVPEFLFGRGRLRSG